MREEETIKRGTIKRGGGRGRGLKMGKMGIV